MSEGNVIQGNNFSVISWEGESVKVLLNVSRALLNMTELFKASNINVECLLKVEQPVRNDVGELSAESGSYYENEKT